MTVGSEHQRQAHTLHFLKQERSRIRRAAIAARDRAGVDLKNHGRGAQPLQRAEGRGPVARIISIKERAVLVEFLNQVKVRDHAAARLFIEIPNKPVIFLRDLRLRRPYLQMEPMGAAAR